ncbi:MAG: Phosphatidylinositol 3,4,5-trisphosphate-dependent Rac exchanger 2 protein [Ramalina farinacea]|uniref:Phosphatidylinositol 3,4,5-trisphosphate-dependent Rac exchanger 2 protein n=1 Tax=Ramalina farinacea TaxID=258253 RepID=A0AA43TZ10_9LECA|nr:Phosphatidylinositol 3,4,5-trisphosphate-dependent Rac exchanger 2 protein [Ramalina farinacea]
MSTPPSTDPFIFIDCEMTGLSPSTDSILSLCCYITSPHLRLLSPTPYEAYITHPPSVLAAMSQWCLDHHGRSGLVARCSDASRSTDAATAARGLLDYMKDLGVQPQRGVMAGNSIHCDREFLRRDIHWNEVVEYLSYRILDVSSFKEGVRRWGAGKGGVLEGVPGKEGRHEAKRDIEESIEEMRYYRRVLFGLGDEEEEGEGRERGEDAGVMGKGERTGKGGEGG